MDKTDKQESAPTLVQRMHKILNTNFDRAFGMDISDHSVEIAELSKLFRFSLESCGRIELPEGMIKNGRIVDEKGLAEHIRQLLLQIKPRKVSTNKVVLSLPQSQVFTHHFVMNTPLKGDALKALVQKELTKILPINLAMMYWDIKTKPIPGDGTSIMFIGIQKEIAESYIRTCNSVGLVIVAFGLEPLSIARLLLQQGINTTAIVDIGMDATNVSIIRGNDELTLAITIPVAGKAMTKAISQGLNIDEAQAEAKKLSVGTSTSEEVFYLVEPVIKEIAQEVKRITTYYETTFKESVKSLVLVGGASVMGGIREKVAEVVGKPTTTAFHFNNYENLSTFNSGHQPEIKKVPTRVPGKTATVATGVGKGFFKGFIKGDSTIVGKGLPITKSPATAKGAKMVPSPIKAAEKATADKLEIPTLDANTGKSVVDEQTMRLVAPMLYTSVIGLAMLGASNEFEDINLIKQIPPAKINDISRGELFKAGYLSKVTAFRVFLNSRVTLAIALVICVITLSFIAYVFLNSKSVKQAVGLVSSDNSTSDQQLDIIPLNSYASMATSSTSTATSTATTTKSTLTGTTTPSYLKMILPTSTAKTATTTKKTTATSTLR